MANTAQSDTIREEAHTNERGGQAVIFAPAKNRRTFPAVETSTKLKIDGRLDEADWQRVQPAQRFVQVDPQQGQSATFDTEVRVLFNRQFLYIAAFNRDSSGRKALRVPNFKRDFQPRSHDFFGIAVDGFSDRRNAMAFMTNPYGTQRDHALQHRKPVSREPAFAVYQFLPAQHLHRSQRLERAAGVGVSAIVIPVRRLQPGGVRRFATGPRRVASRSST